MRDREVKVKPPGPEVPIPAQASSLFASRLVRPAELAKTLGVSRVTLWRWERAGRLPKKRHIGPNVVGWLESEIEDWFNTSSSPHAEEATREDGQ